MQFIPSSSISNPNDIFHYVVHEKIMELNNLSLLVVVWGGSHSYCVDSKVIDSSKYTAKSLIFYSCTKVVCFLMQCGGIRCSPILPPKKILFPRMTRWDLLRIFFLSSEMRDSNQRIEWRSHKTTRLDTLLLFLQNSEGVKARTHSTQTGSLRIQSANPWVLQLVEL